MGDNSTLVEQGLDLIQNNRLIAAIILFGAIVIALATFTDALKKLRSFFFPSQPKPPPDQHIVDKLVEMSRREGTMGAQLEQTQQELDQERELREQLEATVRALSAESKKLDARPGIEHAIELLGEGRTEAAEAIFAEIESRREAEGKGAFNEAATAALHRGALAELHDS